MSSNNSALAELVYSTQFWNYCAIAITALLLYEHMAALSQEVEYVWKRKKTGATVLYLCNRFLTLGMVTGMILGVLQWRTNTVGVDNVIACPYLRSRACACCAATMWVFEACAFLLSLVWAGFSALRVYAVGLRAWKTAAVVFILNLVPLATNVFVVSITANYSTFLPIWGNTCFDALSISLSVADALVIINRTSLIIADIIVLVVTWMNTYTTRKQGDKTPLLNFMLRVGTFYFILLLLLNATHLTLYLLHTFIDMSYFVTAFSSIIFSRFLLAIRQIRPDADDSSTVPNGQTSLVTLRFATQIVEDMGAPLNTGVFTATGNVLEADLDNELPDVGMRRSEEGTDVAEVPRLWTDSVDGSCGQDAGVDQAGISHDPEIC